jgi:hypothetical protein
LLNTFWNALGGWCDRQLADGTIIWTSPTGHPYVTYPGSLMPRRRHTRAADPAKAKAAERNKPPPV